MIRLVVVDARPVVREGLKRIVSECRDMRLVAEAGRSDGALEAAFAAEADVLLLGDVTVSTLKTVDLIRDLQRRHPKLRVLVLGVHDEDRYAVRVLRAGAAGYLTTDLSPGQLVEAIRRPGADPSASALTPTLRGIWSTGGPMKTSRMTLVGTLVGSLVVLACSDPRSPAAPLAPSFTTTAPQSTTYSGQATVVQATVLGQLIRLVNAGPLPPEGGAAEDNLLAATVPGLLSAEVLHAATIAGGSHSRSEASVANVTVTAGGDTIPAGFLLARGEGRCTGGSPPTSRSPGVAVLTVKGPNGALEGHDEHD